jgi:thiol:disulfide interchange protein DsbC
MSRISVKSLISLLAVVTLALPAAATADDAELEQVRKTVGEMFDMIGPDDVKASPVPGWYTIQKGSIVAYISGDGRYLLQGDLIDLDQQVNLTEVARNDTRRALMASVTDDDTIVFEPEKAQYTVTVFTDIECTYCRRLHAQIDEYMANGIRVRYLLYPRNGPASRAWTTSEDVWCSPDRGNALTMAKLDRDFPSTTCDTPVVSQHYAIGREVGLSGTPAIVLEDGTLIGGYLPPDQLKARLDQLAAHP